MMEKIWKKIRF